MYETATISIRSHQTTHMPDSKEGYQNKAISDDNKIVKLLGSLIHWVCHLQQLWTTTLGSIKPFDVCENGAVISSCTLLRTSFPEKKSRTHSTFATSALWDSYCDCRISYNESRMATLNTYAAYICKPVRSGKVNLSSSITISFEVHKQKLRFRFLG